MKKLFVAIIEDATGGSSTVRFNAVVANLTACLVWMIAALAAVAISWNAKTEIKLPDLPVGVAGYCPAALALKVWQRVNGEDAAK
jgi:hypothetical protein